ncbi:GNAT family N-acetyltransferase [Marinilactibacillus sp. XAAS-LB27]|uniref:GNAT family N-acetyltransferase n=1 Tax=Marinilactibacillus sp. XAAS-LB27 TaxID=3114538 RepID=UPI002E1989FE|nr:GNAT family N-acetyltransferase [Marinilactibacillus sp. XAAS-LB27]
MPIEEVPYEENKKATITGLDAYTLEKVPKLKMVSKEISFVYKEADEVLGSIVGHIQWDHLKIELFFVSKNTQGKGIGSKLLAHVEKLAKTENCQYIFLETMSFNAPAFYQKNGYEIVGKIDNSPLPGETRYFMKKDM